MISNLFVRVKKNMAFKVIAIVDANSANDIKRGAVIDTLDNGKTAVIADIEETKLTDHMWHKTKKIGELQSGHEFVRITQ